MRVVALLGLAAFLLAAGPAWSAERDLRQAPRLIVLEFSYLDTSGEAVSREAEHDVFIAGMQDQLRTGLADRGLYEPVRPVAPPACPPGDSPCLLAYAREAGADLVLAGAIHKASTLITQIWIGMFDAESGERVLYRDFNFRGDDAEAWRRAGEFLIHRIEAGSPRS
jgi:hypothetical protein